MFNTFLTYFFIKYFLKCFHYIVSNSYHFFNKKNSISFKMNLDEDSVVQNIDSEFDNLQIINKD